MNLQNILASLIVPIPDTFEEAVIELLDEDGGIVYTAFPDSCPEDLVYAESYLDEGYAVSGYYYPPNSYPLGDTAQYEIGYLQPIRIAGNMPEISFDNSNDMRKLVSRFR